MKHEFWQWIFHPIKTWKDWQYKKYKKQFFTNKGKLESNKFHREAKRVK